MNPTTRRALYKVKDRLAAELPDYVVGHAVIPTWPLEDSGELLVYIVMERWTWLFLGILHLYVAALAAEVAEVALADYDQLDFSIHFT